MLAITLSFLTSHHHVFISSSMLENLLYVILPQKQEKDVSLVLKDSDRESENLSFVDLTFCTRWPENREFKSCIIYRFIIYYNPRLLTEWESKCGISISKPIKASANDIVTFVYKSSPRLSNLLCLKI